MFALGLHRPYAGEKRIRAATSRCGAKLGVACKPGRQCPTRGRTKDYDAFSNHPSACKGDGSVFEEVGWGGAMEKCLATALHRLHAVTRESEAQKIGTERVGNLVVDRRYFWRTCTEPMQEQHNQLCANSSFAHPMDTRCTLWLKGGI